MRIYSITLVAVVLAAFACLMFFSYQKYVVAFDYTLYAQVDCDSETESCFVYECDPESEDWCDPEEPFWYYKVIYMYAPDAPQCTPTPEEDCPQLTCEVGMRCEEVQCDESNMGDYQEVDYCA